MNYIAHPIQKIYNNPRHLNVTEVRKVRNVSPYTDVRARCKHEDASLQQHFITYLRIHRTVCLYKVPLRR